MTSYPPNEWWKYISGKTIWICDDQFYEGSFAYEVWRVVKGKGAVIVKFDSPIDLAGKLENIRNGKDNSTLPDLIITDLTYSPTHPNPDYARFRADETGQNSLDFKEAGLFVVEMSKSTGKPPIPVILMSNKSGLFDTIKHPEGTDFYLMDKSLNRFNESGILYNVGNMLRPERTREAVKGR